MPIVGLIRQRALNKALLDDETGFLTNTSEVPRRGRPEVPKINSSLNRQS